MHSIGRLRSVVSAMVVGGLWLGAGGCSESDGLPREAVAGSVSIDGKPLRSGLITFMPSGPDTPTQGGAAVVQGQYSIEKAHGLVPSKYTVRISGLDDTPEKTEKVSVSNNAPGMAPVLAKEAVPSIYNSRSILTADVTSGGNNKFIFDLTSTPPK
ncbi:hypothetical protein SAMN05444166_0524 [Singulisphaera sp. GP187]|uniref:hypothetical protein n=1 Tax=Singulisphaera sp. GP187 TaxID=1882752 RepID=UPI000929ADDD|nr:hypothetical protein [Singulisphaera sp. GP187]SIN73474.1 hypothetical protein SAMN05444166_0524 [Singulisphaera sp. GP187]